MQWLHNGFEIGMSPFELSRWRSIIHNFIGLIYDNISDYVTTISFLTLSVYYKQQNAQCSDEYSVHKINTDIHLVCESVAFSAGKSVVRWR